MISKLSDLDLNGVYTYADYINWQLSETVELIKGRIFAMSPAPRTKHQRVSRSLNGIFYNSFKGKPCEFFAAPFDVRLYDVKKSLKSPENIITVVQPDICVICDATKIDELGCLGTPDLIIEILSPGNSSKELRFKYDLYEESGVKEYWIADPNQQTVHQFLLNSLGKYELVKIWIREDALVSVLFPCLEIRLEDVFQ